MKFNQINSRLVPLGITVLLAAYFIILFYRGFNDPDEGRYAEIPREMVAAGNWLEMRMLGFRYYEKPPLTYWFVAPAIKIFGAHDWAVRIPLLISGFAGFLLLALAAVKKHGRQHGIRAAFVTASLLGFLAGSGLLMTDSFLMVIFTATCLSLYFAFEAGVSTGNHFKYLILGTVFAWLGFLTKGAVAVVLPAAILFLWLLWERRLALIRPAFIGLAVLFGALLLLPVLWLIETHNPGFIRHFIYEEHIARFTGTRATQLHPEPFWFFLTVLPLLLLPWTLFLFRAGRNIWKQKVFGSDSFSRFLFVWVAVVVCFFSASTGKLMSYILPAIPPLGLLIGRWGVSEERRETEPWDRRLWGLGTAGFVITALVICIAWCLAYFRVWPETIYPIAGISVIALVPLVAAILFYALMHRNFPPEADPPSVDNVADIVRKVGPDCSPRQSLPFSEVSSKTDALAKPGQSGRPNGRAAASLLASADLALGEVSLKAGPLAKPGPRRLDFEKLLFFNSGIMLAAAILLSPLAGKDFNVLLHINSSHVYKALARHLNPDDKIVVFWSYRPALPFYTRRLCTQFHEENELFYGIRMEPERPGLLKNAGELREFCARTSGRVFAVVEPQDLEKKFLPLNLPYRETTLPRDPDTIIYELIRPFGM